MKTAVPILAMLLAGGCAQRVDYSSYADPNRASLSRIASLDARLRALLGEEHPDASVLPLILDSLRDRSREPAPGGDTAAREAIAGMFGRIGLRPLLLPGDSDLVPSLAWSRRKAGCVPLVLFWIEALRVRGVEARPVPLPGHLAIAWECDLWIETLRGGLLRTRPFYDSAFRLRERPYFRELRPAADAVLAALLVHAGLLEWRRGRTREAESAFRAAVKICPGLPAAEGNLGLVLAERGDIDESRRRLALALRGDPLANPAAFRHGRITQGS